MAAAGLLAVAVGAAGVAFAARLRVAVAALIGVIVLVPDSLLVPGLPERYPFSTGTVVRVVLYAFAAGLVARLQRHPDWRSVLRPTPVHAAFAVYVGVAVLAGVALAEPGIPPQTSAFRLFLLIDQAVLFSAVLVAVRLERDPLPAARALAVATVVVAVVAVGERLVDRSFAGWVVSDLAGQAGRALPFLETRSGVARVRGPSQFALAFAWVAAALVPTAVVVALAARRRALALLGPAVVLLAIAWTVSRSVVVGLLAGAVVLVTGSASARVVRPVLLVGIVAALVFAGSGLRGPFAETRETEGSVNRRLDRLAVVTGEVADRPVVGLGLGSLTSRDIRGTDSSYLLAYVETGLAGLAALVTLLASAVALTVSGLRGPPGRRRATNAAVAAGLVAGVVGSGALDLFSVPQGALVFWLLAALGVGLAEQSPAAPGPRLRRSRVRLLLPVAGVAAGAVVLVLVPRSSAVSYRFTTLSMARLAPATSDLEYIGTSLSRSACEIVEQTVQAAGGDGSCRHLPGAGGLGEVRVEASDPAAATRLATATVAALEAELPGFVPAPLGPPTEGKPTLAATAPAWLAALAAAAAALTRPVPWRSHLAAAVEPFDPAAARRIGGDEPAPSDQAR